MLRRWRATRALRRFTHRRVSVSLIDGTSIQGALMDASGDVVVLVMASTDTPDMGTLSLDGLVVLDRRQIRIMQVLDPAY